MESKKKTASGIGRGNHPNSRGNLKPWEPGCESPNPTGRPKKIIAPAIERTFAAKHPKDPQGRTYLDIMVQGAIIRGAKDASMFREIRDMIDGPVTKVFSGPDGGSIPVKMTLTEVDEQLAKLLGQIENQ